jgi:hypothetical protein
LRRDSLEPDKLVILLALVSGPLIYILGTRPYPIRVRRLVIAGGVAVLAGSVAVLVENISLFWRPVRPLTSVEAAWREVELWAKENTPRDTVFLVPPFPDGFRAFSQRSCWGSWEDGNIFWLHPSFAREWRRRITALGLPQTVGHPDWEAIAAAYRKLSWERLREIARDNNLQYIIQYADVRYEAVPVFSNEKFSVYPVAQ